MEGALGLQRCSNSHLVGDPTKAEPIVQRVKLPPHYKIPPHTHPYSEIVTVLSGTYWNAMGDDIENGVMLKPGSVFVLPANHVHHTWTTDEEVILRFPSPVREVSFS